MDTLSLSIGLGLIVVGLVTVGLAIPMARGKTRRNPWYGVRLTESMKSDEAWDAINRYGGRQMIAAAIAIMVLGVVAIPVPLQSHPLQAGSFIATALMMIFLTLARIIIFEGEYAKAASKSAPRERK